MEIRESKRLKQFGRNIRAARERKGLTQRELSDLCGVDNSKICKIEQGKVNMTLLTLIEIAVALNISPAALLRAGKT